VKELVDLHHGTIVFQSTPARDTIHGQDPSARGYFVHHGIPVSEEGADLSCSHVGPAAEAPPHCAETGDESTPGSSSSWKTTTIFESSFGTSYAPAFSVIGSQYRRRSSRHRDRKTPDAIVE